MPQESERYFTELAERIARIEKSVEGVPDIADKVERVRVIVEGVDGDNGMKGSFAEVRRDVAEIKLYRSNEDAVEKAKKTFLTPITTVIMSVIGAVAGSSILNYFWGK